MCYGATSSLTSSRSSSFCRCSFIPSIAALKKTQENQQKTFFFLHYNATGLSETFHTHLFVKIKRLQPDNMLLEYGHIHRL